jgi:endoglucanase
MNMDRSLARVLAAFAAGAATLAVTLLASAAPAIAANTGTVVFTQTNFTVNENAGSVELDLVRNGDTSGGAIVHWYTAQPGKVLGSGITAAMPGFDYTDVSTYHAQQITFSPGQKDAKISVQIVDHHMPVPTKYLAVKIFGAGRVGSANVASIEITGNEAMPAEKDQSDPLALNAPDPAGYPVTTPTTTSTGTGTGTGTSTTGTSTTPAWVPGMPAATAHKFTDADPLQGVNFYAAPLQPLTALYTQPGANLFLEQKGNMQFKDALAPIWSTPQAIRYGTFDINSEGVDETAPDVANYLQNATKQSPNTVPEIITYDLCHNSCRLPGTGHPTIIPRTGTCGKAVETPAQVTGFENFINQLAEGISDHRAVVYLEEDALITMKCLVPSSRPIRVKELQYAVNVLGALPRAAVYIDAGSDDAGYSPALMAHYLNEIGVDKIQGFFVNSTHFDWTLNDIKYGQEISRRTGGAHFVVDTEVNGNGPEVPQQKVGHGNEVLCNPTTVGLGPKPTTDTGYWHVDAFAWLGYPGLSDVPAAGCPDPDQPAANGKPYVDPFANPKLYPTGKFIEPYAQLLIKQADYNVKGTVKPNSVEKG